MANSSSGSPRAVDNPRVLRAAHILQLTAVAMLCLAIVMTHSAGSVLGGSDIDLARNALYALIAVGGMMVASRVNVAQVMRCRGALSPVPWALLVSLALTGLVLVPGVGKEVNGAARWLEIGPIGFQPSEMVKWAMVPAIAWWCARRRAVMSRPLIGLAPALLAVAAGCGLIIIEDLGTAALIAAVAVLLLLAGGARLWQLALAAVPGVAMIVLAILHSPYRVTRLLAFLDPWADPQGSGYHPIQSMIAFATGGVTGKGLGNGIQKFGYLPEDTTDFIFASICEELGITGALLVVAFYLVIIWTGLSIIRRCGDTFTRLFGLGVVLTIGLQALINLAVVTVLVPSKGIALPLISKGGTGWILTAFMLGLLASLDYAADPAYRENHPTEEQDPPLSISASGALTG